MIYSNMRLESNLIDLGSGSFNAVTIGEREEYGCNLFHLGCTAPTVVYRGMNKQLSIEPSLLGNPKIVKKKDDCLYMLLSTKGRDCLNGNGVVLVPAEHKENYKVLARARSGDVVFTNDAKEENRTGYLFGYWDHLLIQVPATNAILQVCNSGSMYGKPPCNIYVIHNSFVHYCTFQTIEKVYSKLEVPMPCEVHPKSWGANKLGSSWVAL